MRLFFLILSLFFSCHLYAQDIVGVGSTLIGLKKLTDNLSFSIISVPPTNTLHWKITRNKGITNTGLDYITAGDMVLPGEQYAYYWDKEKKIFWFATVRTLLHMDVSDWTAVKSVTRSTKGFYSYHDLPPIFRNNVAAILK
jgi:hypothetical protein